jgi:hypothetical protein
MDCSYLFCWEGSAAAGPVYSGEVVHRRRGRSRTPRRNVNADGRDGDCGSSRRRRISADDGYGDRGSKRSGDPTHRAEPVFKTVEKASMDFCSLSNTILEYQKRMKTSLSSESPFLSARITEKKRRVFKPSPRSPWTCRERAGNADLRSVESDDCMLQKGQRADRDDCFPGIALLNARPDTEPATATAQNLPSTLASKSQLDYAASAQGARARRRWTTFGERRGRVEGDSKSDIRLSRLLTGFAASSNVSLSIVSRQLLNKVDSMGIDKILDERSTTGTSNSGSFRGGGVPRECDGLEAVEQAAQDTTNDLSPKPIARSNRPKTASRLFRRNVQALSPLVAKRGTAASRLGHVKLNVSLSGVECDSSTR